MEIQVIKSVIEGILFASGDAISIDRIANGLGTDKETVKNITAQLSGEYRFEQRGIRIIVLDNSLQMVSAPEYADIIRRTLEERKPPPMSKPALEILSLIAYYQPITRAELDKIRAVDSAYTISTLLEKGLIEEAGRLEVMGRPILYRTTPVFLRTFGLSKLEDLPELTELEGQLTIEQTVSAAEERV